MAKKARLKKFVFGIILITLIPTVNCQTSKKLNPLLDFSAIEDSSNLEITNDDTASKELKSIFPKYAQKYETIERVRSELPDSKDYAVLDAGEIEPYANLEYAIQHLSEGEKVNQDEQGQRQMALDDKGTTVMLFNIFSPDEISALSGIVGENVMKELETLTTITDSKNVKASSQEPGKGPEGEENDLKQKSIHDVFEKLSEQYKKVDTLVVPEERSDTFLPIDQDTSSTTTDLDNVVGSHLRKALSSSGMHRLNLDNILEDIKIATGKLTSKVTSPIPPITSSGLHPKLKRSRSEQSLIHRPSINLKSRIKPIIDQTPTPKTSTKSLLPILSRNNIISKRISLAGGSVDKHPLTKELPARDLSSVPDPFPQTKELSPYKFPSPKPYKPFGKPPDYIPPFIGGSRPLVPLTTPKPPPPPPHVTSTLFYPKPHTPQPSYVEKANPNINSPASYISSNTYRSTKSPKSINIFGTPAPSLGSFQRVPSIKLHSHGHRLHGQYNPYSSTPNPLEVSMVPKPTPLLESMVQNDYNFNVPTSTPESHYKLSFANPLQGPKYSSMKPPIHSYVEPEYTTMNPPLKNYIPPERHENHDYSLLKTINSFYDSIVPKAPKKHSIDRSTHKELVKAYKNLFSLLGFPGYHHEEQFSHDKSKTESRHVFPQERILPISHLPGGGEKIIVKGEKKYPPSTEFISTRLVDELGGHQSHDHSHQQNVLYINDKYENPLHEYEHHPQFTSSRAFKKSRSIPAIQSKYTSSPETFQIPEEKYVSNPPKTESHPNAKFVHPPKSLLAKKKGGVSDTNDDNAPKIDDKIPSKRDIQEDIDEAISEPRSFDVESSHGDKNHKFTISNYDNVDGKHGATPSINIEINLPIKDEINLNTLNRPGQPGTPNYLSSHKMFYPKFLPFNYTPEYSSVQVYGGKAQHNLENYTVPSNEFKSIVNIYSEPKGVFSYNNSSKLKMLNPGYFHPVANYSTQKFSLSYLPPNSVNKFINNSYTQMHPPAHHYSMPKYKHGYNAPSSEYKPPSYMSEYKPPIKNYWPPPKSKNMSPPSKNYRAPKFKPGYNLPKNSYSPPKYENGYSPPSHEYLPPKYQAGYKLPSINYLPPSHAHGYNPPSQEYIKPIHQDHGMQMKPPSKEYLPPSHINGYNVPNKDYTAPKFKAGYKAPSLDYIPPLKPQTIGLPNKDYIPPKSGERYNLPKNEYTPPSYQDGLTLPNKEYLPPSYSQGYNAPNKEYTQPGNHDGYRPPTEEYLSPSHSSGYKGPIKNFEAPHHSAGYQIPTKSYKAPNHNFGLNGPTKDYTPPEHQSGLNIPSTNYVAPHNGINVKPPSKSYIAPELGPDYKLTNSDYIPPNEAQKTSNKYGPPNINYTPIHEPPNENYLPPTFTNIKGPDGYIPPQINKNVDGYLPPKSSHNSNEYPGSHINNNPGNISPHKNGYTLTNSNIYISPDSGGIFSEPIAYDLPNTNYNSPPQDYLIENPKSGSYGVPPESKYIAPFDSSNQQDYVLAPNKNRGPQYSKPPPRVLTNSQAMPPNKSNEKYIPPKMDYEVPKNYIKPDDLPEDSQEDEDYYETGDYLDDEDYIDDYDDREELEENVEAFEPFLGLAKLLSKSQKLRLNESLEERDINFPPMPTLPPQPENFLPILEKLSPSILKDIRKTLRGKNKKDLKIPGKAGVDYPDFKVIPDTDFSCTNFILEGFYADTYTSCQVFHVCESGKRQSSFLCPKGTIFNQKHRVCDWWYNVKCENSAEFYDLNLDILLLDGRDAESLSNGIDPSDSVSVDDYDDILSLDYLDELLESEDKNDESEDLLAKLVELTETAKPREELSLSNANLLKKKPKKRRKRKNKIRKHSIVKPTKSKLCMILGICSDEELPFAESGTSEVSIKFQNNRRPKNLSKTEYQESSSDQRVLNDEKVIDSSNYRWSPLGEVLDKQTFKLSSSNNSLGSWFPVIEKAALLLPKPKDPRSLYAEDNGWTPIIRI